jgi:hypothetical protein
MVLMLTIAGGILLAVLVLAMLPWALLGLIWIFYAIILIAIVGGAVWLAMSSSEGLAVALVLSAIGGFWLWLQFKKWPDLTNEPHFNNLRELVEHRRRKR